MNLKGSRSGNEENRWEAIVALMRHDLAKMLVSVNWGKSVVFRSVLEIEPRICW